MPTCLEVALERLRHRAIKESTHREYLATLRRLDLADVPFDDVTVAMLNTRLDQVLTASTRRKHAINLRACLGLPVRCPRPESKTYDLPPLSELHAAIAASTYADWGFLMLHAGLRLGEACTRQELRGNVLTVDRQLRPGGQVAPAKTTGPVVLPGWLASHYPRMQFGVAPNTVYIGIRRAGSKAGLDIRPHMLRHAFATNLVRAGATPEVLRRQMRHHDVSVSLRYYVQTTHDDVTSAMVRMQVALNGENHPDFPP